MRETFRILFLIRKNQLKNNGLATVMIRITINGKQVQFSSKVEIYPNVWSQKENKVVGDSYLHINNHLLKIQNDIKELYISLSSKMQHVSANRLKQAYLGNGQEMYLSYQFREQVKIFRTKAGRNISERTVDIYNLTHNRITEFLKMKYKRNDILIQEIDLLFLEYFYCYLRKEYNCSNNTTIKYMKRFAAIMNFAEKTGLLKINPFRLFRFQIEKKLPVYLIQEEVNILSNKKLTTKRLSKVRDAFIFSCYTGITFCDLSKLRFKDIESRGNTYWLIIMRQKTNTICQIPLLDEPLRIIKKYHTNFPNTDDNCFVFDMNSNQKTNEYLKEIANICGINKKVSFHTARHTFATLALDYGISLETVTKMLGRVSIRTTQIYANVSKRKIQQEMEKMKNIR